MMGISLELLLGMLFSELLRELLRNADTAAPSTSD